MIRSFFFLRVVCVAGIGMVVGGCDSFEFDHVDGFEQGEVDTQWWIKDSKGNCEIDVTDDRARAGLRSVRFTAAEDSRCELVHWASERPFQWIRREPYEQSRWYGFSVFLPNDRPAGDPGMNEVIAQWHASDDPWLFEPGGRGPPLALRIQENRWRITFGWDGDSRSTPGRKANQLLWEGPANLGSWTDWVFHVIWDPVDDGLLEVWKNGRRIAEYHGPVAYNDLRGVYLKLGSYHPRADQVVYLDEVRIGSSSDVVQPLIDGPGFGVSSE